MAAARRKTRLDLPPRMYHSHGAYYYVTRGNKWLPLGKDLVAARVKWAELESGVAKAGTMADAIDRYMREVATQKAPATLAGNRLEADTLRAVFGHMPVADVDAAGIHAFMIARGAQSKVRANRERSLMHAVMRYAVVWGLADRNPVREVPRFAEPPRVRYVTDDEFIAARDCAPLLVQCMMDLALLTAQRGQDLLSLRRDQITDAGLVFAPAKVKSRKPVRICVEWTDELRRVVDALRGFKRPFTSLFLVTSEDGNRLSESGWKTAWQRTMARAVEAGVARFHFHDLRAKAITDMELAGGDAQTITGHAGRVMIDRIYKRLAPTSAGALKLPAKKY